MKAEKTTLKNETIVVQAAIDNIIRKGRQESVQLANLTFDKPETAKKFFYELAINGIMEKTEQNISFIAPYSRYYYNLKNVKFTGNNPSVTEGKFMDWLKRNWWWISGLLVLVL